VQLDWNAALDYGCAIAFGVLVAIGELASRYRDAPARALQSYPGMLYMGINGAAAGFALMLIHAFHWKLSASTDPVAIGWTQILTAGFGSVAFFRTSLFTVRAGDHDVAVGPSTFLQIVMRASDSAVDRAQAQERSDTVTKVMANVSFKLSNVALPAYCLALMQNVAAEDQKHLGEKVAQIASAQVGDSVQSLMLGLAVLDLVGEDVLKAAAGSLGALIKNSPVGVGLGGGVADPTLAAGGANAARAGAAEKAANSATLLAAEGANAVPTGTSEGAAKPAMASVAEGGDAAPGGAVEGTANPVTAGTAGGTNAAEPEPLKEPPTQ